MLPVSLFVFPSKLLIYVLLYIFMLPYLVQCNSGNISDYDWSPSVPIEGTWECGADEFSKYMSELTIERDCPTKKNPFNKCCITHDHCYDAQLGRKYCDDIFCDCIMLAAGDSEVCAQENVPSFCGLVREFGAEPYHRSRHNNSNQSRQAQK